MTLNRSPLVPDPLVHSYVIAMMWEYYEDKKLQPLNIVFSVTIPNIYSILMQYTETNSSLQLSYYTVTTARWQTSYCKLLVHYSHNISGYPIPIPLPARRLRRLELSAYGASVLRPPSTQNPD